MYNSESLSQKVASLVVMNGARRIARYARRIARKPLQIHSNSCQCFDNLIWSSLPENKRNLN